MLWMSMALATAAVLAFWVTIFFAPSTYPQREFAMKLGTRLTLGLASIAIFTAILGEGPERKWVAFSSLVVPFHWVMAFFWQ